MLDSPSGVCAKSSITEKSKPSAGSDSILPETPFTLFSPSAMVSKSIPSFMQTDAASIALKTLKSPGMETLICLFPFGVSISNSMLRAQISMSAARTSAFSQRMPYVMLGILIPRSSSALWLSSAFITANLLRVNIIFFAAR